MKALKAMDVKKVSAQPRRAPGLLAFLSLIMVFSLLLAAPGKLALAQEGTLQPQAPDAVSAAYSYTNNVSYNIPDGSSTQTGCAYWPATRYFLVNDNFTVNDLNVEFSQSHDDRGQIQMKLTAPDGTTKTLMATSSDTYNNYYITIDDASSLPLDDLSNDTIGGTRRLVGPSTNGDLDAFNGKNAHGHWTMTICDNTDSGTTQPTQLFNEARLVFDGTAVTPTPLNHQQGPAIVETYFTPWPEDQVWTAFGRIFPTSCSSYNSFRDNYDAAPRQPMVSYTGITIVDAGTVLAYDQWEDGYEADLTYPTQSTTQVWGDGNLNNGVAPGDADDLLSNGQILVLNDVMLSTTLGAVVDFDARDKIGASKPIGVTRSVWSDGSQTMFAAADEVYPVDRWGTQFYSPVGDTTDLNNMFDVSMVSIIAAYDGTLVDIDKDGNGVYETTGVALSQGGAYLIDDNTTGMARGGRIRSNSGHPIQVNLMTADNCAGYESRSYPLLPYDQWDYSYYTPVSTITTATGPGNDDAPTTVHLYNPGASTIYVGFAYDSGNQSILSITANSGVNQVLAVGESAHFFSVTSASNWTPTTNLFYAVASVDSDNAGGSGDDQNSTYDWGITLVPEKVMSQWVIVGWAPGDDPTFQGSAAENTAPIWLTGGHPAGSSTPSATYDMCVDYNGDCTSGSCTLDSVSGRYYDRKVTGIAPLTQMKIYKNKVVPPDTGQGTAGDDQTGTSIWVCGPTGSDAFITGAWGGDPLVSSPSKPGLDMGYTVRNQRAWRAIKSAALQNDLNGNGLYDEGDTIRYTIQVFNASAVSIPTVNVADSVPANTTYVNGSTYLTNDGTPPPASGTIPDSGTTSFPLDEGGYNYTNLDAFKNFSITFNVTINLTDPFVATRTNTAQVTVGSQTINPTVTITVQNPPVKTGAIGNYVWLDEDGDGDQDAGEPGIPNVLVTITNGTLTYTTYTDANGGYLFTDLPVGAWTVTVTPTAGLNPTYDENGIGTPNVTTVALTAGEEHLTADFGYNWSTPADTNTPTASSKGAIGDTVFFDQDPDGAGALLPNGIQDPGELGIAGVTVNLYTAGPDGLFGTADDILYASTTTDANGNYIFNSLPSGAYVVQVVPPAGYTQSSDPDNFGANCAAACDNQTTAPIVLAPGDVFVNADFGYTPTTAQVGSIGDTLWVDSNRNNAVDAGEARLPGVSVSLIKDTNGNGVWDSGEPIIATDITDANGQYLFQGVPAGAGQDYLVWVNDANNVLSGLVPVYDSDSVATKNISAVTNLTTAGNLNQDFAYAPTGHDAGEGLIGDTIFLDRDGDGVADPGEGMEGVMVKLFASDGVTLLATTTTNENGQYFFGNLNATGTYVVQVQTGTLPFSGLTNTVDPDGGGNSTATVNLAVTGPVNLAQDFGYRDTTNPNTIGGTIFNDANADGTLNEAGVYGGVTVVLMNSAGNIVATTTTAPDGSYSFTNLPDGTYKVVVTDDANVLNGAWKTTGSNPGVDGNSQVVPYTVSVSGGQTNTTADFGYYTKPAILGDRLWYDDNNNGLQDDAGGGLANWPVTLTIAWPGGGTTTLQTTTDANGYYSFANLLQDEDFIDGVGAGEPTFTITTPIPSGYQTSPADVNSNANDTTDSDGIASGANSAVTVGASPNTTAVLVKGDATLTYDFGFAPSPTSVTVSPPLASAVDNTILVAWQTYNEIDILSFNLYRAVALDGERTVVYSTPALNPGKLLGDSYSYSDADVQAGVAYSYWLEVVLKDGSTVTMEPTSASLVAAPVKLFLPTIRR